MNGWYICIRPWVCFQAHTQVPPCRLLHVIIGKPMSRDTTWTYLERTIRPLDEELRSGYTIQQTPWAITNMNSEIWGVAVVKWQENYCKHYTVYKCCLNNKTSVDKQVHKFGALSQESELRSTFKWIYTICKSKHNEYVVSTVVVYSKNNNNKHTIFFDWGFMSSSHSATLRTYGSWGNCPASCSWTAPSSCKLSKSRTKCSGEATVGLINYAILPWQDENTYESDEHSVYTISTCDKSCCQVSKTKIKRDPSKVVEGKTCQNNN